MNKKLNNKNLDTAYLDIAIPQSVENLQLPNASLITYYKNLEKRILWLDSEENIFYNGIKKMLEKRLKKELLFVFSSFLLVDR